MTTLTRMWLRNKSDAVRIEDMTEVDLWGHNFSDISVIREAINLRRLSAPGNFITTLAYLQDLKMLEKVYLRDNKIKTLDEIVYLKNLPLLKDLWLEGNPCVREKGYRMTVVRNLPQLEILDQLRIDAYEKKNCAHLGRLFHQPVLQQPLLSAQVCEMHSGQVCSMHDVENVRDMLEKVQLIKQVTDVIEVKDPSLETATSDVEVETKSVEAQDRFSDADESLLEEDESMQAVFEEADKEMFSPEVESQPSVPLKKERGPMGDEASARGQGSSRESASRDTSEIPKKSSTVKAKVREKHQLINLSACLLLIQNLGLTDLHQVHSAVVQRMYHLQNDNDHDSL